MQVGELPPINIYGCLSLERVEGVTNIRLHSHIARDDICHKLHSVGDELSAMWDTNTILPMSREERGGCLRSGVEVLLRVLNEARLGGDGVEDDGDGDGAESYVLLRCSLRAGLSRGHSASYVEPLTHRVTKLNIVKHLGTTR